LETVAEGELGRKTMAQRTPTREEFEISDTGIVHKPTEASFVPFPGRPTVGTWHDGRLHTPDADYDADAVKDMMRKILAEHLIKT
jgi:hypothetical protein